MDKIMALKILLQNTFILRRSGAAKFANIVKIVITFIKTTFKDSKKQKNKRIRLVFKSKFYLYFLI